MTVIVTVLKTGGEYRPEHVQRLHRQFGTYHAVCLTDVAVEGVATLQLAHDWPGWFAKMALFDPELIQDDILYFDLDTLLINSPQPYLTDGCLRMLSDFYYPTKPASGMMFIPHHEKIRIWPAWIADPQKWMRKYRGDQDVIEAICGRNIARFGNPVKSYKVHVAVPGMPGWHARFSQGNGEIPVDTDVLCFHGFPRPWDKSMEGILPALLQRTTT